MNTVYLMNTTMMPNPCGIYTVESVQPDQAEFLLKDYSVVSAIGHQSAADAMSAVLDMPVQMNRMTVELNDGDAMLCLKLNQRLPEGQVIDLKTMDQIGYSLVWVWYQSDNGLN